MPTCIRWLLIAYEKVDVEQVFPTTSLFPYPQLNLIKEINLVYLQNQEAGASVCLSIMSPPPPMSSSDELAQSGGGTGTHSSATLPTTLFTPILEHFH